MEIRGIGLLGRLQAFLAISDEDPDLLKAQYGALAYQLPMLYCILLISAWVMAYPHLGRAPLWLALGVPGVLSIFCTSRGIQWWSRLGKEPSTKEALTALRLTNLLAPVLAAAFVGWAITLFPYGDAKTQGQVAFFMGITAIGCIFCLMHLKSAAFLVALIDNSALLAFFATQDNPAYVFCAINAVLVTGALLVILLYHHRDFARMVVLNAENKRLADRDSLTGLPNRRYFFHHLTAEVDEARHMGGRLAVGILDLDGFKPVNDLYGHAVGDRLLRAVTKRLSVLCEGTAQLARLGGDEFALLIAHDVDDTLLHEFGIKLCEALRTPFAMGDTALQIGGSIGFACYPDHAVSADHLYEFADYALYHGKRHRRGSVSIFNAEHNTQMQRDASIEIALRKADLEQELSIMFQPIVDVTTGQTVAFEALARWDSGTLGPIGPDQFIPIAERGGLIGRLTLILLGKALHAARFWPENIRLSFNLSAHDLCSPDIVLQIVKLVSDVQIDPRRVDFEITETALLQDINQVQETIRMLKLLGCSVSLDDFGTGYSSLSHIHALPFTKIKIDRSFVHAMHTKPASYKIIKSLLALSRDMGIDCVIEGVETEDEMTLLRKMGGNMVQGYFFSPPIRLDMVEHYLSTTAKPYHGERLGMAGSRRSIPAG